MAEVKKVFNGGQTPAFPGKTSSTEGRLSVAKDAVSGLGDKAYESFREVFEDMAQKHEIEVRYFHLS